MAGAHLKATISDLGLPGELVRQAKRARNAGTIMAALATDQAERVRDRFKDEVGPGRVPWAPLAPATIARRRKMFPGAPISILRMRGHLTGGIVHTSTASGFTVGTDGAVEKYAAIHQFGGEAGRDGAVTIPARPYLGFDEEDVDILSEELLDYLSAGD